jgi:hypothetical protein
MNVNKIIIELVNQDRDNLSKLKKSELLAFATNLLKDYYYELDNQTIIDTYNERI